MSDTARSLQLGRTSHTVFPTVPQFRELGQWHAVLGDTDRTRCGRDAIKAERMYVDWDGIHRSECCRVCLKSIAKSGARP